MLFFPELRVFVTVLVVALAGASFYISWDDSPDMGIIAEEVPRCCTLIRPAGVGAPSPYPLVRCAEVGG